VTAALEKRLLQAAGCALALMRKAGKPPGIAIHLAAKKYDVHESDLARELNRRPRRRRP